MRDSLYACASRVCGRGTPGCGPRGPGTSSRGRSARARSPPRPRGWTRSAIRRAALRNTSASSRFRAIKAATRAVSASKRVVRDQDVHEADRLRLLRVDALARIEEVGRHAAADEPREVLRPPAPGIQPRVTSGRPNCAVSDAMRRSHASASSRPPPRAYPRTIATTGFDAAPKEVGRLHLDRVPLLDRCPTRRFVDVASRGEGPGPGAPHDDHPDLGIVVDLLDVARQGLPHRVGHGVQLLGAVERQRGHPVLHLVEQLHVVSLLCCGDPPGRVTPRSRRPVDDEVLAGDELRVRRGQEDRAARHVLGRPQAAIRGPPPHLLELAGRGQLARGVRQDEPRADRIDGDPVGPASTASWRVELETPALGRAVVGPARARLPGAPAADETLMIRPPRPAGSARRSAAWHPNQTPVKSTPMTRSPLRLRLVDRRRSARTGRPRC